MSPRKRNRWLALAAVPAAAALIGTWTVTQGRAEDTSPTSAASPPAPADPHAGHGAGAQVPVDGTIRIDPQTARSMGVTVVEAELAPLSRSIRTNGNVVFDETRLTTVTPKFSGFVERLYVDFTGQAVRRGQPLLEIYSPELVAAQEELLSALRMERQLREGATPAVAARTHGAGGRRPPPAPPLGRLARAGAADRAQRAGAPHAHAARALRRLRDREDGAGGPGGGDGDAALPAGGPLHRLGGGRRLRAGPALRAHSASSVQVEIAAYPGERLDGRVSYVYPEVRRTPARAGAHRARATRTAASSRGCTPPCRSRRR
jgi:hypothetical protein